MDSSLKIPAELIKKYPFMAPIPTDATPEYLLEMLIQSHLAMLASFEREALLTSEKALLLTDKALLMQKLYGKSSEKRKKAKGKDQDPPLEPLIQVFDEAVGAEEIEDNIIEELEAECPIDMTSEKVLDQVVKGALPPRALKTIPRSEQREDVNLYPQDSSAKTFSMSCLKIRDFVPVGAFCQRLARKSLNN